MSKREQKSKGAARTKVHQTFVEDLRKGSRTTPFSKSRPASRSQVKNDIRRGVEDI